MNYRTAFAIQKIYFLEKKQVKCSVTLYDKIIFINPFQRKADLSLHSFADDLLDVLLQVGNILSKVSLFHFKTFITLRKCLISTSHWHFSWPDLAALPISVEGS